MAAPLGGGDRPITAKQQAFAEAYLRNGRNATQAYRSVYKAGGRSSGAVHVVASRLLDNAKVKAEIDRLTPPPVTAEVIQRELCEVVVEARADKQYGAAVSGIVARAKVARVLDDGNRSPVVVVLPASALPDLVQIARAIDGRSVASTTVLPRTIEGVDYRVCNNDDKSTT